MKNIIKEYKFIAIFFILVTFILFWQFFLKGLYPVPSNYMLAWYEPWKTDNTKGQTITIPHKPVADDTFRYLYPFKKLGTDMLKKGMIPLWNPYNGAGMPLLATYQWAPFNPFNIIFLFLESRLAWSFYIVIQAFLLSFFTYIFCRKIHISIFGAIFSSIIFLFSGFVIARLVFGNLIYPLITLPILLFLIEDFVTNPKSKKIFLLPISVAFMLISGHPHVMVYALMVALSYFIFKFLIIKKPIVKKISIFLLFTVLFILGVGIATVQLFPTIELLRHSNMTPESSVFIFSRFLLPPSHLLSILIPNYFGNQATYNYWGAGDYIETVAAVGIIPTFFAYFSLFGMKDATKKIQLFFLLVTIVSILSTLNWFVLKFLATLPIPILSTSPPSRVFVLTSFSIAILAGLGFDLLFYKTKFSKQTILKIAPFIILILAVLIGTLIYYKLGIPCHNQFIPQCRLIALRNTLLEACLFTVATVFIILYLKLKSRKLELYIPIIIILLVISIGLYNSNKYLPFSRKETIMPEHPVIQKIKQITKNERVFGFGEANIKTNFATFFRFYDPQYFDPLYNKRYGELIAFANTNNFDSALSRSDVEISNDINLDTKKNESRSRILSLLGTKYFIYKKSQVKNDKNIVWQDKNWQITENENALPRSYTVSNFEVFSSSKDLLNGLFDPSFDPSKTVLLEERPTSLKSSKETMKQLNNEPMADSSRQARTVNVIEYKPNKVVINVETNSDQLLVLSDNYYPGWKAYVYPEGNRRIDDKETKIYRANYTFRAVELPAGNHKVRFSYEPNSFKIGLYISIISTIIYIIIAIYRKFRSRHSGNQAKPEHPESLCNLQANSDARDSGQARMTWNA